jgi:hypothetical protein
MAKLTDKQIEDKLKPIENKIRNLNNLTRGDIQDMINTIIWYMESYDELKKYMEEMVVRTGVKNIGVRTTYTPRQGLKEEDKTLHFIKDLRTYRLIEERFFKNGKANSS